MFSTSIRSDLDIVVSDDLDSVVDNGRVYSALSRYGMISRQSIMNLFHSDEFPEPIRPTDEVSCNAPTHSFSSVVSDNWTRRNKTV
jgi:hypothetical protein